MLTCVPDGSAVKNPPAVQDMEEMWIRSPGWEDPQEEEMATTTVFLPGEFHEQRRLVDYSPWGHKESELDSAEHTHTHTHTHTMY